MTRTVTRFLVGDTLTWAAATLPTCVAATLDDDSRTFLQLEQRVVQTAHALTAAGVVRGDRVTYWADISLRNLEIRYALSRLGATFAPLNPRYTRPEAATVVAYLRPHVVVADAAHIEAARALGSSLGVPVHSSIADSDEDTDLDHRTDRSSVDPSADWSPLDTDIDTIYLTSGSTGTPKGVMLTQRANWLRCFGGTKTTDVTGGAGEVCMFPLFHMAGWNFIQQSWSLGRPIHLVRSADPDSLLRAVERHRAAVLYCIPAVWHRILDHVRANPDTVDTSSLEWALTGTSLVTQGLLREIKTQFPNTRTTVSYGSTEAGQAVVLPDDQLFTRPDAIGLPVPGTFARVAADGELQLKSDWLMSGYFELPEQTAAVLEDGWYRTGDLVTTDADGYLSITGRTKDLIRTGGEFVAPVEVEQAVRTYPGIAEAAVIGIPDDRWGELVCAVVELQSGYSLPTVDDMRKHIGAQLAAYKHPRRLVRVDSLPRTSVTGRVQRSALLQHPAVLAHD